MSVKQAFLLYYLLRFQDLNRRKILQYMDSDPTLNQVLSSSPEDLHKNFHLTKSSAQQLYNHLHNDNHKLLAWNQFQKFNVLTWFDENYPDAFRHIPDPPLVLYYQGNLSLLNTPMLSVIGTRNPSLYAQQKIEELLSAVVENQITITSGLAQGIDGMSHRFALSQNANTIAILGFGFDHIYPSMHKGLLQEISQLGLVITEYPPHIKPQKWHFPERNRLISGLSSAILIIEAAERSGTLITADQALEQGKDIFVVPDSIFLEQSKGCHKLLREGAIPITSNDELNNWLQKILQL
ncbi:DNA-processing protein DprA [Alkalibacillus aidingensis]|uniref:DNA-processing protein DprA n=1 Tax=Alkalibacillus aidingensis TaxID=2747607 RepID=UPI0016605D0A|nr:DNA-processing protein DprA [Alkalibacillus aidingensis]